ncbi:MAG: HIT family protein [Oleiphilus sp.]|nr:MAG: HIT family protein [Oleiphilus sp.]
MESNEPNPCPFCDLLVHDSEGRVIDGNEHGFVIRDGFPVTEGHTLIISRKHAGSFFEFDQTEQFGLLSLVNVQKKVLDNLYTPLGFNVGINDGAAAGQTVPHLHIHLIPRYEEEGIDPRGGVRWIIPEKANYWS